MTEVLSERITLNMASMRDTDIGHEKTPPSPAENMSMGPIVAARDGRENAVKKLQQSPDENDNLSVSSAGSAAGKNGAVTSVVGTAGDEEFGVAPLDEVLLEDARKCPAEGCHNPAYEHDGLPAKYSQPSCKAQDAYLTEPSSSNCPECSRTRTAVAVVVAVTACVLVAIIFFMIGHFSETQPSVKVEASVCMLLLQDYLPAYNDPSTSEYQALERKFVVYVTEIFQSSHLRGSFESVFVTRFRPGSVSVEFTVTFHQVPPSSGASSDISYLQAIIKTEINYVLSEGVLKGGEADFMVDKGSISVSDVTLLDGETSKTPTEAIPTTAEQYQGVLSSDSCGLRPEYADNSPLQRIVQGERSDWGKWPWLVSLRIVGMGTNDGKQHMCGATLISDRWAATAAHCVSSPSILATSLDDVLVGDIHLEVPSPHRQLVPVERILIHPGYQYGSFIHLDDLALIKLARPVELTDYARPVCLAREQRETANYENCYIAGWGRVAFGGNLSVNVLDAKMKLVELGECIQRYESFRTLGYSPTEGSICFEPARDWGNAGPCNGDSGGPLMCEGDGGRWYMVGIISLGVACNSSMSPAVATRVSAYYDYITAAMDNDSNRAQCEELRSGRCSTQLPYRNIYARNQSLFEPVIDHMLSVNGSCSEHLEPLICSLVFPGCVGGNRALVPCRDYCKAVVEDCDDTYLEAHGFPLRVIALCHKLPEAWNPHQMMCFQDQDSRCGNQSTITLPQVGHVRLQSHNFVGPYGTFLDCAHVIVAPPRHRVLVKTRHMSLQQAGLLADLLEVGDGRDAYNKTTIVAKLRGLDRPPVILSEGESMWVRFTSGVHVANDVQGYDLELHALSRNNVSALCSNDSVGEMRGTPDWWKCDGIVDCPTGVDEVGCGRSLPDVLNTATCGLRPSVLRRDGLQYRIVNGTKVDLGVWPWMAYLRLDNMTNDRIMCGASLIGDRWLTTAAHCVSSPNSLELLLSDIVIGDVHLSDESPHHQLVPIERIYTHPGYNRKTLTNDIAIVKLARPVEITDYARPVCLDAKTGDGITERYTKCYTAGWGLTEYTGDLSYDLLEADMSLVELEDCSDQYEGFRMWGLTITDRVTCVKPAGSNVSATACKGDSGGPVMCQAADGRWNMVGIVSLGVRCTSHPVVVTRVAAYIDYIANVIEGDPHPAKCEQLQSETCSGLLPYDHTFPTSQEAFDPVVAAMLANATCSAVDLTTFMCMLLFEGCTADGRALVPCREYCVDIVDQCDLEYSNATGVFLGLLGKCQTVPDAGRPDQMICYKDEDARCGNQTDILLSPEGSITLQSHNYPDQYGVLLDCTTLVTAPPGHRVLVKFNELSIEECCEMLAFGAGHDAHDKRTTLAKFRWAEDVRLVVSPSTMLWMRFASRKYSMEDGRRYSLEMYAVNSILITHLCNNESAAFPYSPPDGWMCDGIVDCPGGVDEEGCPAALAPTTDDVLNQDGCGVEPPGSTMRIVGGTVAETGQWPWLGSLRYQQHDRSTKHGCAASLVSDQWVVTAAHCVDSPMYRKREITVVFGDPKLNETTAHHVEIAIEAIYSHPGFNHVSTEHDIAVLKLARPVTYTAHVRPVCLDTDGGEINNSSLCYIAGWGLTNLTAGNLSVHQQELEMQLLSQTTCIQSVINLGLFGIVTENMICAQGLDGQSPCNGDSGGALVCRNDHGVWYEVGVISAVFGCSSIDYPGFYTHIASYVDFINSTINGDSRPSCEPLEPANNCSDLVPYTNTFSTTQSFYQDMLYRFGDFETCHDRAKEFMCMMLMPGCDPTIVPCRDFCQEFLDNCSGVYSISVGLPLRVVVDCEVYPVGPSPETVACIDGEDARCQMSDSDGEIHVSADAHAILYSPRYPSYDVSLRCTWLITGPPTSRGLLIKFLALDFGVEKQNVLVVGYGHSAQNLSTLLERYNGLRNTGPLLVQSSKAWIWYATGGAPSSMDNVTDEESYDNPGGFKLEIHATNVADINSLCTVPQDGHQSDLTTMPAWWYCDGFPDCPSGADEMDCPSPWYNESYFLNSSTCGRMGIASVSSPRIVGGTPASAGVWPWMVSLRDSSGSHWCGATLISEYWAISAAHCLGFIDYAVLGDLRLDSPSPFHVSVKIKDIYSHKGFNFTLGYMDLILLRLARPVQLNDHVNVVCLPDPALTLAENTTCVATGWGYLEEGGNLSTVLQEVEIPLLSDATCQYLSPSDTLVVNGHLICAGYIEGQVDTCQGDSGGPLQYQEDDGRWTIVGLTSFGLGCARPETPGYYTRVASAMDFILAVVGGETHPMAVKTEIYP